MAVHERFHYKSLEELRQAAAELKTGLRFSEDVSVLKESLTIGGRQCANAFAVLPMEGCDSEPDGGVTEAVRRRYLRFASGGAGLLWWEACAVVPEGRANPSQMMLTDANRDGFSRLLEEVHRTAYAENGVRPINILQLTHSGRYSRPFDHTPRPLIAQHDPWLDRPFGLHEDDPILTDDYLERLVERYVHSARLAKECGFDGVDIKACHRYLLSELLSARNRGGKYGGCFENRSRLLLDIIEAVQAEVGSSMIVASRFNAFDAHPYPYGFGSAQDGSETWDDREPVALTQRMVASGVSLLSASAGNPYYLRPNVTRPFDLPTEGGELPPEHPLQSVARLFHVTETIQRAAGSVPVVGTGYSWLRQYIPYAAAANIQAHACRLVGLGRSSIAYPNAPADLFRDGCFHAEKCCIACSKCTQIMRDHGEAGCVIRDSAQFAPKYAQYRKEAAARARESVCKEEGQ